MRGAFTCSNDFYLPSRCLEEGGGVSTLCHYPSLYINVWWRHAILFLFIVFFVQYMVQEGIDVKHYCCLDVAGWKRQEVGLKRACRLSIGGLFGFF
jgi:hypothetical protein